MEPMVDWEDRSPASWTPTAGPPEKRPRLTVIDSYSETGGWGS